MEELWETVSQEGKDGTRSINYQGDYDLLYLFANGLVDFKKYTLDDWIKSFVDSKQSDGSYKVSKDQWLAKRKYRYEGPIGEPFDPDQLQEREFTEDEFKAVFIHFICPVTWAPESSIPQILEHYRKNGRLVGGRIRIDKEIKNDLRQALERIPNPLRILQLDVARIQGKRPRGIASEAVTPGTVFVAGTHAQKVAAAGLNQIIQKGGAKAAPVEGLTVPLKELQKKRKRPPTRA
jgi:hypothetical protein